MSWRRGQAYARDLRDRVLSAVDGGTVIPALRFPRHDSWRLNGPTGPNAHGSDLKSLSENPRLRVLNNRTQAAGRRAMTAPMRSQLIGRWWIVDADLWDRDYLDLVEPAMMTIRADRHGEIAFGAMQASLDLEYSRSMVFFTWAGFDKMDDVSGSGSAELLDDRTI